MARWLLVIAVLCAAHASASYRKTRLEELIAKADGIVEGTVASVEEKTFTLEIKSVIAGRLPVRPVRIAKFHEWRCATRWAPYAVGQQLLLFLSRTNAGEWEIMGAGGEGELPMGEGFVFSRFFSDFASSQRTELKLYGGAFEGFAADVGEVTQMLKLLRACLEPKSITCTPETLAAIESDETTAALHTRLSFEISSR